MEDRRNKLKIGLPKGGLLRNSIQVVERLINAEVDRGCLSFQNDKYEIFLLKHRDIPKLVEDGKLDIGITSFEWIRENQNDVEVLLVLDWCDTKICSITSKDGDSLNDLTQICCATEFPNIALEFFRKRNIDAFILSVFGSSEAFVPMLAQVCIDCVETGETIEKNNLQIQDVIMESKVVVIKNKNREKKFEIEKFCNILNSL